MTEAPNPYDAPHAVLVETDRAPMRMPPTMMAALAIYLVIYPLEVVPLIGTPMSRFELFVPSMAAMGVYTLVMTFALWRRWQWARLWLVLTTAVTAFFLIRMLWRGLSPEQWHACLAAVLRIAVTVLLLLPASRRWFAAKAS
ncbi:hypothetical protein ASD77_08215 [Pseudoxanthomonas sp. Root65]|uniref:hypothetical protein n=1 Tax=Pseudoxanthomonas sp. Root65 TaxID=1736576 RepID=UPI0006F589A7|nr:hypothetical protein [Pseudoxanthomonas sp. Root65]KRA54564.1 hypothetical protein ASD77_08215 [Pseudoxanthomonas sp. Root65]